ncbi:MAG: class IV adenylate cyclase [Candidatus Korarchaeota archaeon]|nr:class IV adenylate cyclase [Candidatus Korarchaeota archaeon]
MEREVKLKIPHSEFLSLLRGKKISFKILEAIEQEDFYMDTRSCDLLTSGRVLRVRIIGNLVRITYKGRRKGGGIEKVREEIEGELGDEKCGKALSKVGINVNCPPELNELMNLLSSRGYEVKIVVWKRRTPVLLDGFDVEVTLDYVRDLGEFVEVEGDDAMDLVRILGIECRAVIPSYADLIHALKQ